MKCPVCNYKQRKNFEIINIVPFNNDLAEDAYECPKCESLIFLDKKKYVDRRGE